MSDRVEIRHADGRAYRIERAAFRGIEVDKGRTYEELGFRIVGDDPPLVLESAAAEAADTEPIVKPARDHGRARRI